MKIAHVEAEKNLKNAAKENQISKLIQSKKPPEVQIMEQMRKAMVKCCMHPDQSNCNGKIKNAHALQNNKIISLLAGTERHVYTMDKKRQPLICELCKKVTLNTIMGSKTS